MSLELQRTVWLAGLCPGWELTEELSWALLLVWAAGQAPALQGTP